MLYEYTRTSMFHSYTFYVYLFICICFVHTACYFIHPCLLYYTHIPTSTVFVHSFGAIFLLNPSVYLTIQIHNPQVLCHVYLFISHPLVNWLLFSIECHTHNVFSCAYVIGGFYWLTHSSGCHLGTNRLYHQNKR